MSPLAEQLLNWILVAAIALALWGVVSIAGWLLHTALRRFAPDGLSAATRKLFSLNPLSADAIAHFFSRITDVHGRVFGTQSVRVVLERRHKEFQAKLRMLRAGLNDQLMKLSAVSPGKAAPTLITLLTTFKTDVAAAQNFGHIDDDLVDHSMLFDRSRARYRLSLFGAVVVGSLNAMLLHLFFREFEAGVFIPFTKTDVIIVASFLFPLVEFAAGFYSDYLSDSDQKTATNQLTKWFVVFILGAVETFVFYLLFKNIFENANLLQYADWAVPLLSVAGFALALLQAMVGSGAGRAARMAGEYATEQSIKDQVKDANAFVNGLPSRYDQIGSAARNANQAVDQLASDLNGHDAAELPLASAVDEKRREFLAAVDAVNPAGWTDVLEGNGEDAHDAGRFAWLLPFALVLFGTAFVLLVAGFLERSGLFGDSEIGRWSAAFGAAAAFFIGGGFVFRRIGLATSTNTEFRDTLFPRDDVMRLAAVAIGLVLTVGVMGAGIAADGVSGVIEGLFAVGAGIGLCLVGSYPDLVGRGLSFLCMALVVAAVSLVEAAAYVLFAIALGAIALLFAVAFVTTLLIGWPLLMFLEHRKAKATAPSALVPART